MRNNKFVSKMFTHNYFEKENTSVNSITNLYKALAIVIFLCCFLSMNNV